MILESLLNYLTISLTLLSIIALISSNNLMKIILLNSAFSMFTVIMYLILDAPDVAITEACVSILTSIFSIFAIHKIYKYDYMIQDKFNPFIFVIIMFCTILLIIASSSLPEFGQAKFNTYYLKNSSSEIGIPAVVTSILASYRGYDTLMETLVIMLGAISILLIKPEIIQVSSVLNDLIAEKVIKFILPLLLLFSFYLQFHGEISPGGGFQAGTIIAASFILYAIIFGNNALSKFISLRKLVILSISGIAIYFITGLFSILKGAAFLNYNILTNNQITGQTIGIVTIEIGIGITVAASMLIIYLSLSDESN